MSDQPTEHTYENKVGNLVADISKRLEDSEEKRVSLVMRIAALEAQNKKLVEALEKIKRQDPYTTTNKSFFDFVYNTAKNALSEVTQ